MKRKCRGGVKWSEAPFAFSLAWVYGDNQGVSCKKNSPGKKKKKKKREGGSMGEKETEEEIEREKEDVEVGEGGIERKQK